MASKGPVGLLYRAMKDDDHRAFERILKKHPDVVAEGADGCIAAPLISAVWSGQPKYLRRLLEAGADVHARDLSTQGSSHNLRAIDAAWWFWNKEMLAICTEYGARTDFGTRIFRRDAKAVGKDLARKQELIHSHYLVVSYSLLHVAAVLSHAGLTQLFLDHGLDASAVDSAGHTALRYAARNDPCLDVMEALISAGCDLNQQSKTGITALTAACRHRESLPSVEWLLEHGADPGYRGARKETAVDIAHRKQSKPILDLLKSS
jgi:hypothetical protein